MGRRAELQWTRVICKEQGRYIGWPTIARSKEGELLVVFSGDRDEHICPWGKTELVRSSDEGETWSEPVVIRNTPLDDRDAGIIQTQQGALVVSWFTSVAFENQPEYQNNKSWQRQAAALTTADREGWLGRWTHRSEDGGATWQEPVRTIGSAPHGPIQLRDGRLLYLGTGFVDGERIMAVEESKDDGRSWQLIGSAPLPTSVTHGLGEPHLVEADSGRIIGMFRSGATDDEGRYLFQSESDDGGHTWTPVHRTPILGYPPHLISIADGTLLVVYGRRVPPLGEWACISRDEGASWDTDDEVLLAGSANDDLGYPASVQLEDGSILTIYYHIDQPGEPTCLMGTKWRLH
jgi:hypothetical protein